MSAPDGGPAFPVRGIDALGVGMEMVEAKGITVRDYFAGQAMVGIMSMHAHPRAAGIGREKHKQVASEAYALADAMLAERSS